MRSKCGSSEESTTKVDAGLGSGAVCSHAHTHTRKKINITKCGQGEERNGYKTSKDEIRSKRSRTPNNAHQQRTRARTNIHAGVQTVKDRGQRGGGELGPFVPTTQGPN